MTKRRSTPQTTVRFMTPGALGTHLDGFMRELEMGGYARLTRLGYAMTVAHFAEWARSCGLTVGQLSDASVARFARHRCHCPGGRQRDRVSRKYARRAGRFIRYLERCGVIAQSIPASPSLPEFRHWLLLHRGSSMRTVEHYVGLLVKVLPVVWQEGAAFTAAELRALVLREARRSSRAQTRCITCALRAYLRFLASSGRCTPGLDQAIPTIPQWRLSSLPRYLPAGDVERIIDSCDTGTAHGLRDRAILLLLARLALRGGDIVRMRLDDIDWRASSLKVCGKARREDLLPLPQDVGDAVLAYLERARPRVGIERLFLCLQAPYRSLPNSGTVSAVVSAALHRAGISKPPSRGANLLRHSAATAMLRAGVSLEAVSRVLRHRSVDMTGHYAKVDIRMLTLVVQPWPEGAPC